MFSDYEGFKRDVYLLTKIDLDSYREKQMRRRIDALISKQGLSNYADYVALIKKDKEERKEFVNYLTINVSEFFRNPRQWEILDQIILPDLIQRFGENLKVWSAACSTGEEPYSLAMLLAKHLKHGRFQVLATDIDRQALGKARLGIYSEKSFGGVPTEMRNKYFLREGKTFQVSDELKSKVHFKSQDLLKDPFPFGYHLIVCRNVLIYFTEEAKDQLYAKFNSSMTKGGVLFIGSTEQIINYHDLNFKRMQSFFFEKL